VIEREVFGAGERTTNAWRFSAPGRPTSAVDKAAVVRTRHPDAGSLGFKVRAVVKLMQRRHRETFAFGVFYVGLGDQFDDDRRRVHQYRRQDEI
jgi:hypothetical protein